jgi:hypothetical protein
MRLWTLHPRHLDPQGLVALWREALLAKAVIRGKTTGYRHHPQLQRFLAHRSPAAAINAYLHTVLAEARTRGYSFDAKKVAPLRGGLRISATAGQLDHEWLHLGRKLKARSPAHHRQWREAGAPRANPLFRVRPGGIEAWERA